MVFVRLTEFVQRRSTIGLIGVIALGVLGLLFVERMAHALEGASDAAVATLGLATLLLAAVSLYVIAIALGAMYRRRNRRDEPI